MSSSSSRLSSDDWNARIARAAAEKKATEATKYGVKISTMLCDFFVSEDVIPAKCKSYEKGVLKRVNLASVNGYELIMKEIFRKKHSENSDEETDISVIKKAMFALLNILNFNFNDASELETTNYNDALSGAVGFLFSALDNNPVYDDVLNSVYRKKFRTMVYHFSCISKINRKLAAHFYDHCRSELAGVYAFPDLIQKVNEKERMEKPFISTLIFCLDLTSLMYEWKESVIESLDEIHATLAKTIKYFNENPTLHSSGRFPKETALAIRGNVIGLHVARLSAGAMSLLKNKTFDEISDDDVVTFAFLTPTERKSIQTKFSRFISAGNAFRHTDLFFSALPTMFKVKIEVPKKDNTPLAALPNTSSTQSDAKTEPQNTSPINNSNNNTSIPQGIGFFGNSTAPTNATSRPTHTTPGMALSKKTVE